jgi:hypothetical protein
MKTITGLRWTPWWLSISATVALLLSGCATSKEHSFNADFGEKLPTRPTYAIQDKDANHYTITVHQGSPSYGAERVINVKEAASTVAKAESKRRGWEKWQLDYIQERDLGWMHIVIAEVKRQ